VAVSSTLVSRKTRSATAIVIIVLAAPAPLASSPGEHEVERGKAPFGWSPARGLLQDRTHLALERAMVQAGALLERRDHRLGELSDDHRTHDTIMISISE
jgi:hypothetical protein